MWMWKNEWGLGLKWSSSKSRKKEVKSRGNINKNIAKDLDKKSLTQFKDSN